MGEFFTWLSVLPTWLGITLFFIIFLSMLAFAFSIIYIGLKVKYRGIEISLFGRKKRKKDEDDNYPYSPHRDCNYRSDVVLLLNTVNNLQYKKFRIIEIETLKEQMRYAESKIDYVKSILQRQYLQILQSKDIKSLTSNLSFLSYKNVLGSIKLEMTDTIRHIMRENHLAELSEEVFLQYCEDKFTALSNELTEYLNILYVRTDEIKREELYDWNKKLIPELRIVIYDMFQTARKIAIEYICKANELDKRIDEEVHKYI